MNKYQKFNTYGKLRSIVLGSYYSSEYFSTVKNKNVRDTLIKITDEINEDLTEFEKILTQYGAEVLRPKLPLNLRYNRNAVHTPPLSVRNYHCVVGNTMYQLFPDWTDPIAGLFEEYCSDNVINLSNENQQFYQDSMNIAVENYNLEADVWYSKSKYDELKGSSWPEFADYVNGRWQHLVDREIKHEILSYKNTLEYETKELGPLAAPNIINTDSTIFVDANEYCDYAGWLGKHIEDHRNIIQFTSKAGHVDGCFNIIGPELIIGISPLIDYQYYFPDYSIIKIPDNQYAGKISDFQKFKQKVPGRWWVQGEESNEEFTNFVDTNLEHLLGFSSESFFDVNILPLDESTVCVSNLTSEIERELKKYGITPVYVPWRHRFFVDGGLHCITLDLYRDK